MGVDALIAAVVLYFFFTGIADGSVSLFNVGLWLIIVVCLAVVMGGSIWLRSAGRRGIAIGLLLLMAIPGILLALFFAALVIAHPRWN